LYLNNRHIQTLKNHNDNLSQLYDEIKGFKHDMNNIVQTLGGYIENSDINGLQKYYSDFKKDYIKINNNEILNSNMINDPGIYNLINSKYQKAVNNNINVSLELFFDFTKLNFSIYEFSRILGILLDNAIEAAKDSEEKQINIMFRKSSQNNVQIFSIENTYCDKNVNTEKIFEKGLSGKSNHSGIGLWEVKQILKRHKNIDLITEKNDIYFKQQLEIY
jgi:two-component system sensor histidine kinase AgrC